MVQFTADDDLRGARFRLANLTGARFDQSYLTGVLMRGVDLSGADIDGDIRGLVLNGVEVAPLVEAELNRRLPGREWRRSLDPAEQLQAFDAAQREWAAAIARATARPELRDAHVDGEWSISQTLRHLVMATDGWLRHGVQRMPDAFSPIGVPFTEWEDRAAELGMDPTATPSWDEVLAERADRVAQVRDFLAAATPEEFAAPAPGLPPWHEDSPEEYRRRMTVGRCLGVIGNEEWEHLRYAVRDLDTIEAGTAP
ncbi:DinB family protein [Xylanimonas sp. McL0601]|uniref:DinB family protein n=1 Tax=Xylanimonas sp. McL0601 TaxID=3414739 RepID=UPI003CF5C99F